MSNIERYILFTWGPIFGVCFTVVVNRFVAWAMHDAQSSADFVWQCCCHRWVCSDDHRDWATLRQHDGPAPVNIAAVSVVAVCLALGAYGIVMLATFVACLILQAIIRVAVTVPTDPFGPATGVR